MLQKSHFEVKLEDETNFFEATFKFLSFFLSRHMLKRALLEVNSQGNSLFFSKSVTVLIIQNILLTFNIDLPDNR